MKKYKYHIAFVIFFLVIFAIAIRRKKPSKKLIAVVETDFVDPGINFDALALRVYNAFKGLDWTSTKSKVIEEMIYLNDDELKQLYNVYNENYHPYSSTNTLVSDLYDEWIWGTGVSELKRRFKELNLS
jgi:hypothetical protein